MQRSKRSGRLGWWLVWLGLWSVRLLAVEDFAVRLERMEAQAKAEPTNAVVRFELGRMLHWEGTLGRKDVGEPAVRYLRESLRLQPTNAFARALIGSSLTLQARDASFPTTRLRFVRQGLAEMDAAIKEAPEDHNVRFTRACNNLFLPNLFRREGIVKGDFAWLDDALKQRGKDLGTEFCQWTRLYQGLAKKKYGDPEAAQSCWVEGLKLDPKTEPAQRIKQECGCEAP